MGIAVVTGSAGLIGSEASRYFAAKGMTVVGIDNDMRQEFFGAEASTKWQQTRLEQELGPQYLHFSVDIRNATQINQIFNQFGSEISLIIHTAAQPSHDWAARDPQRDFSVNANGTLNLLEATRQFCPEAVFIFTSTNKVYGDRPNMLPLVEQETRWEIDPAHPYQNGVPEDMSIDRCLHSLFGASKVAADILVQEYGRYFGLKSGVFRGGCLTGPNHSGTQLHGFLSYLMSCAIQRTPYTVFGYKGKQVRDNIHSYDLIRAFDCFYQSPRAGEVYNIGGGRQNSCSMLEAIEISEELTGNKMDASFSDSNRTGDHIWYISDCSKFQSHFPEWTWTKGIHATLAEIFESTRRRQAA